jgi:hypothetical protein
MIFLEIGKRNITTFPTKERMKKLAPQGRVMAAVFSFAAIHSSTRPMTSMGVQMFSSHKTEFVHSCL